MKKWFFITSQYLLINLAYGQKTLPDFGVIDKTDLHLKSCSFEPDADAMILFDIQESEFEPSPFADKIRNERRVRIKIFNEKGFRYAVVKIPYYSNKKNTKVSDLKGIVYSLDELGNIVTSKIEETDFYKEKAMEKIGMVTFTFPNVKPGSVIEYAYTITERNNPNLDIWILQAQIPMAYCSNSIIVPAYAGFKEYALGAENIFKTSISIKKGLDKTKTIFSKENIPSLKPEPYMSSLRDNMPRMAFGLFQDGKIIVDNYSASSLWKIFANRILKSSYFDEQFKKNLPGTEKIVDTALTIINMSDRVKYLYRAVKNRIPESQGQASVADDISDTWKSRKGTTAEINMILMNLMKRSGVICFPVLVSTRENGRINLDFPSFGQFNGMDVLIVDKDITYVIDASLKFQPYNIPPLNILNREIFVLDPDNIRWVNITDDRPLLKQTINIFGTITKEGKIEAGATINYFDYAKSLFFYFSNTTIGTVDIRLPDKKIPGLKLLSDNRENTGEGEPLVQTIEFDYETQQSADFYSINPQLLAFKKTNPFILDKRNTDIDFGCNQEIQINMSLQIPEFFQIENLPKSMVVRSPDSSFIYTRITYSNQSNISFSQTFEIKKAIFEKNEYAGLHEFFKRIFGLMSEEIILKKKKQ
ncbi:MAG: DUF3857 domain-containing protein [Sphingobacteriales bacterium]|nr:DUF3857 domain-containing protein [Sphingobacteriales bacterium]